MTGMETTSTRPWIANISKFLVPIAAILVFAVWFSFTPPGLLGKADAVGYAICHRIGERSFHIGDRQLPLCARCTGEFYSAAISLIFFAPFSKKQSGMPGWKLGAPLLLFFIAFGVDGSNSFLYLLKQTSGGVLDKIPNLYIPNNTLRLFTGSGMGIALASILYPAFNQSVWKLSDPIHAELEKAGCPDWHHPAGGSCHSYGESNRALPDCDLERPWRTGFADHRF